MIIRHYSTIRCQQVHYQNHLHASDLEMPCALSLSRLRRMINLLMKKIHAKKRPMRYYQSFKIMSHILYVHDERSQLLIFRSSMM